MTSPDGLDLHLRNPFFVLEAPADASLMELERTAQKLLRLLELGAKSALHCETPLGPIARDAHLVRAAISALRDPKRRATAELHAQLGAFRPKVPEPRLAPWLNAKAVIGWRK